MKTFVITGVLALTMGMSGAAFAESHESGSAMEGITGDAASGEKVFRKCQACHQVGEDAKNRVGPTLTDVLGRTAGTEEGFNYSDAMKTKGEEGLVWTPETIAEFLSGPRDYVKGTKMSFAGLRKEDERADVIAYLATFSDDATAEKEGNK